METAVMVVGLLAEAAAWWVVVARRWSVWAVMTPTLVAMGLAALLTGVPEPSPAVPAGPAAAVGVVVGVVLYLATRAFVVVVRDWRTFREHAARMYARQAGLPLWAATALSMLVLVTGEELFWRGLFQARLSSVLDARAAGAAFGWIAFVAANLPSANLAIVAGAVVGGAVWTALGWWTHGFLASLACHAVWTALMLVVPVVPVAAREAA
jgi:membrane protease YdiL (CAAX protease family)